MKQVIYIAALILGITSLQSCNEKIDLTGGYEETAIVYGLLNQADSLQFIRINRAFIGPGSALDIAQIADSNYFNQIDATISEVLNGTTTRTWTLNDTIIENKDQNGVFFAPNQKLYYFATPLNAPLNKDAVYKLNINVNNGSFNVTSETKLVSGLTSPLSADFYKFEFAENPHKFLQRTFSFSSGNSAIANVTFKVKFLEFTSNTSSSMKSFNWRIGESPANPNSTAPMKFPVNGQIFYELLHQNISTNPSIIKRNLYSISSVITGGSDELYKYMLLNQPTSSLTQSKPTFTNLKATNGKKVIGLFTSRFTITKEKLFVNNSIEPIISNFQMMTAYSIEEMCRGIITGNDLFCSQHVADINKQYHCD
jgi:hypothetical protein